MPFDGSGNFSPPSPPAFPAVSGTTVNSTYFNATINDIAAGLSNCLTQDGQASWKASQNSGGYALTGLVTPTTSDAAASKGYVDTKASLETLAATGGAVLIGANDATSGALWTTVQGYIDYLKASAGASAMGFTQAGASAVTRTAQSKLRDQVNVRDYGAVLDGVTDDYAAFLAAYNACPFGGSVFVPYTAGGAYLSANPDNGSKAVRWVFDIGVKLAGVGMGTPGSGGGTFGSLRTNPWLRVNGAYTYSDLTTLTSPTGGAVVGDSSEFKSLAAAASTKSITGTITNGSSVMTGVSSTVGVYPGDAILSAVSGWPTGTTRTNCMRVVSVGANTITFGPDNGTGSGVATATAWAGSTTAATSFTIRRRHWMAGWYTGLDTGTVDNIDVHYELWNPVLNITGAAGAITEYNLNCYANTADYSRAIVITGSGDGTAGAGKVLGIDIQRGGAVQWVTGVSVRNAQVGLFANAKYPINIDTTYSNNSTGGTETIGYGVHFNNAPSSKGALFEGGQLVNGAPALVLWRNTDTSPTGRFIQCKDAADTNELFFVNSDGGIKTYAPSNSNGSTVAAGSIECNGITLRGGTNIQLGQTKTASSDAPINGYLTLYDSAGAAVKVATIA